MTLPDQLSDSGKQQLAKQIDFFQALTTRAFDNAERIVALNLQTTRELMAVENKPQQQMETVLAYGRKLMEITNKPAAAAAPAPAEHIVTAPPVMVSVPVVETAPEAAPETAASAILPSKHPLGEADPEPAPVIAAKPKPIAKAAGKVAKTPAATPHPAAMPMPEPGPVPVTVAASAEAVPKRARAGKKR